MEKVEKIKIGMMKFLVFNLYLFARITLTLVSSSAIIKCFQKVNVQGFNLVKSHLDSCMCHVSYFKNRFFFVVIIKVEKIELSNWPNGVQLNC